MLNDPDFPPPAPDHTGLRRDVACERGLTYLQACASVSPEGAAWAAYDWLQTNEAGMPFMPLVDRTSRDDARFWAETATPAELQCYALAALDKLAPAPFASKHIRRLVAALWSRMSPDEQSAFKTWINK